MMQVIAVKNRSVGAIYFTSTLLYFLQHSYALAKD